MHYLRLLLITLWLLAPALHADERDLSRLHEIRTLGFDFATNLLLYYAPYEKYPDPHLRQIYNNDSWRILQLSQQLQEGKQLSDSVLRIQALIRELEQQPMDAMQLSYPSWLNPILEEHARLDQTARALYAGMEPPSARTRQVNALSVLMSQLLLLYQVKAYQSLSTAALENERSELRRTRWAYHTGPRRPRPKRLSGRKTEETGAQLRLRSHPYPGRNAAWGGG
jgi:hypothetical protein